jgi:hypothetical protein
MLQLKPERRMQNMQNLAGVTGSREIVERMGLMQL